MDRFRQGAGRLCLDFIRTHRRRGRPDESEELPDAAALSAWLTQFVFEPAEAPNPTDRQVIQARALRQDLYALLDAAVAAHPLPDAARRRTNAVASVPVPAPELDATGRLRLSAPDPVPAGLALVARDAVDLIGSRAIQRVRTCSGLTCNAYFLDTSRPGTRRWCSMNACGNQAKKQTFRQHERR
jgi:predicted RNA-binding Zn ribbon-like protein